MKRLVTFTPVLRKTCYWISDLAACCPDLVMTIKKIPAVLLLLPLMAFSRCGKKELAPVNSETVSTKDTLGVKIHEMFGVNGFEWDVLQGPDNLSDGSKVYVPKWALIKDMGAFRHYMDWEKLESAQGRYTFNPVHSGSWNFDAIYQRAKQDSVLILADLKTVPTWFLNAFYPADQRDNEDIPAPYTSNKSDPASYILQGKVAFQFAARYGYNAAVDKSLMSVDPTSRWTSDPVNEIKIGMGLVKYIECDNERDKWWKGAKAQQTAQEYAANLSAFYDGNKGKLGKNVGVKTADPTMQVVMGGLANPDPQFVEDMIAWCRTNRGYRADGSIDLCFDVLNYHYSSNNGTASISSVATKALAPELGRGGSIADDFMKIGKTYKLPVWVTESGYDINSASPQGAIIIGNKTTLLTQADWIIRTSLLYARHGINHVFYFQLFDNSPGATGIYGTSGLADENNTRRPAADYILQVKNLMGDYHYSRTLNADPIVDKYLLKSKAMYALMIPDQTGRTGTYVLDLGNAKTANIYNLKAGTATAVKSVAATTNGKLTITVTETPVFVQAN